ncbi:MAG: hypothetical protein J6W09_11405 [Bacteroidales bacterium]|nr:hypothetical protein [Bacteroidales bacterium]
MNPSVDKPQNVDLTFDAKVKGPGSAEILSAPAINSFNDFDHPDTVKPELFKVFRCQKNVVNVRIPPASIVVLEL